jgi:hypothetical protein
MTSTGRPARSSSSTWTTGCPVPRGASWTPRGRGEAVARLGRDLADGTWDLRHGHLREQPTFEGSLVQLRNLP